MHKLLTVVAFCAVCPLILAQQTLSNDSVIKLVKAGFSEELIVKTINSSEGNYDTSVDGLIALKNAGATNKVVAAVISKASEPAPAGQATTSKANDSTLPARLNLGGVSVLPKLSAVRPAQSLSSNYRKAATEEKVI